jgi:hypothetical protein
LLAEVICFWVLFFLYVFPFIWTIAMGKERADKTLEEWKEKQENGEDDDD